MTGFNFDIDCGQPFPGHQLVLTGLRLDGSSDDTMHADYTGHRQGKPVHPMMSVTYRVTPALADATFGRADIGAHVRLDPPPDPEWWPAEIRPGEERDMIPGAVETHGAFGPFVVPDGTTRIEVSLDTIAVDQVPETRPPNDHVPHHLGELVINLAERSAVWQPA